MGKLTIQGQSDDIVDFAGVIYDEFYLNEDDTWTGELQSPNGDSMKIRVSFYVTNGKGWDVEVLEVYFSDAPWYCEKEVRYNESYDDDEDYYLVLDVPEGTMVTESV